MHAGRASCPTPRTTATPGSNTLGHVSEAAGGLDLPVLGSLGLGSILPLRGRPARRRAGPPRPPEPARPRQGHDHRPLGADGRRSRRSPLRTYPDGFPDEILDAADRRDRPRHPAQQALQRHRRDRGLRRAAPRDRQPDRLHLGRLGAPDRGARRRGAARRALRGLRGGARDHERRARRRPRDRAAVPRRAGGVRAHHRPPRPRARRRPAAPTSRSCAPTASRSTRSARSSRCSPASASTAATRAPPTRRRSPRPSS